MEREFPFDDVDVEDLPEDLVEAGGDLPPVEPPEPPREGGGPGPRPERHELPDPATGPWFPLSIVAYLVFFSLLTLATLVSSSGGEATAYAITFGLLVVYVGFFVVGAFWFRSHRTP